MTVTETEDDVLNVRNGLGVVADRTPGEEILDEDLIAQEIGIMTSDDQSQQEVFTPMRTLAHPKRQQRIACWNVKTMYQLGKTAQVCREMRRYDIDILGVSECRWSGIGRMVTATGETIVYSGGDNGHQRGVAIIMNRNAAEAMIKWIAVSERIIVARFNSNHIKVTIIQVYAPTNVATDDEKDDFYNQLQEVYNEVKSHDLVITMGDLNAKIGYQKAGEQRIVGQHALMADRSDNGERFVASCMENNMAILTTFFPHKDIHRYTWTSPDGNTRNQIDHIAVNGKFRQSISDARAYRGADVASDHNLVVCKMKLKLTKIRKDKSEVKKYNVIKLQEKATKDKFSLELKNRFRALENEQEEDGGDVVEHKWEKFKDTYNSVAKQVLGYRRKKTKPWISPNTWKQIDERAEMKQKVDSAKSDRIKAEKREGYRIKDKEVKRALRRDKREWMDGVAIEAEQSAERGHLKGVYDAAKTLCNTSVRSLDAVRSKNGKLLTAENEVKTRWKEHFCEILNRDNPRTAAEINVDEEEWLGIEDGYITVEEVKNAIKETTSGRAAGIDAITAELLKADSRVAANKLCEIFRCIWDAESIPNDWRKGIIIKLPKKGDLTQAGNWRGITLLCIPAKIMARIIIKRLKQQVDARLRKEQAGFRKGRGTVEQIFTLRNIIEQSLEWNASLYACFIDYEKAFDSVHRETLWKIMSAYGIPPKFIRLVKMFYDEVECSVVSGGGLTEWFRVKSGVKQGCVMSGFLFLLVIDWIMSKVVHREGNGIKWNMMEQLEDLDFADDIALLASTWQQMQRKIRKLKEFGEQTGLRINIQKTKSLRINARNDSAFVAGSDEIEEIDNFIYLGANVSKVGGTSEDIRRRLGKANAAFYRLSQVWKNGNILTRTKIRILKSNVLSVLLYGCETWSIIRSDEKKLDAFMHKCLRRLLRIRWSQRIRNDEIRRRAGIEQTISEVIRQRRWKFIGHVLRRDNNNIARKASTWTPEGKRRGRPKQTYRRTVEAERQRMGFNSWMAATGWRRIIDSSMLHRE